MTECNNVDWSWYEAKRCCNIKTLYKYKRGRSPCEWVQARSSHWSTAHSACSPSLCSNLQSLAGGKCEKGAWFKWRLLPIFGSFAETNVWLFALLLSYLLHQRRKNRSHGSSYLSKFEDALCAAGYLQWDLLEGAACLWLQKRGPRLTASSSVTVEGAV